MTLRIALITQEDPFYLPELFRAFLDGIDNRAVRVEQAILCPPFGESRADLVRRMWSFHGPVDFVRRGIRYARAIGEDWMGFEPHLVSSILRRHQIEVEKADNVNDPDVIRGLNNQDLDVVVSVAAPQIFSDELLGIPRWGCINVHSAPLPEYRGMMPNFWQMLHGEETAGITVHKMDADLDRGQAIIRGEVPIKEQDSLDALIRRSKRHAAELLIEALDQIRSGSVELQQLTGEGSYFSFPQREDVEELRERGHSLL